MFSSGHPLRNVNLEDLIAKLRIMCSTIKKADTIHSIFSACERAKHQPCLSSVGHFFPIREDAFWIASAGDKGLRGVNLPGEDVMLQSKGKLSFLHPP